MDGSEYLTNKNVILSSGGTKYNDLYYSVLNSTASLVESTYAFGRYVQSLSSLEFGGSSNMQIPNQAFIGETYLHLELPEVPANVQLCHGWGYQCIQQIQFTIGGSNTSSITIPGEALLLAVLAQCSDAEKRSEMIRLGGQGRPAAAAAAVVPTRATPKNVATVLIPLPWSGACGKLYMDTQLITQNVQVNIQFKQSNAIYAGTGVIPTKFTKANLTFREANLANANMSLRTMMVRDPSLISPYPFSHIQGVKVSNIDGVLPGGSEKCNVVLNQFINSDITMIAFYVVLRSYQTGTTTNPVNALAFDNISNVRLDYNGIPLYNGQDYMHNMTAMIGHQSAPYFELNYNPSISGASAIIRSYPVFIDFSHLRSICFDNHFNNTFRLSNQTIQLSFNTETTGVYDVFACYCTNGVVEFQNGQSRIILD